MSRLLSLLGIVALAPGCFFFGTPAQSPYAVEKRAAADLMPAELEVPAPAPAGEPIVFFGRLWADQDVRRLPNWRARLRQQLAQVNAYLTAAYGVRLELEMKPWDREAPGDQLDAILRELSAADPGKDVDLVVAMVAPAPTLSRSHHDYGMSELPGRHMVIRSMNDTVERQEIERAFTAIGASDRQALFEARKHHKELAVFVHEWAHGLGAIHESGERYVMNPSFDHHVAEFSADEASLIRLGIRIRKAERTGDVAAAAALWRQMGELVQRAEASFFRAERVDLAAYAARASGSPTAATSGDERADWDEAVKALEAGDRPAVLLRLDALLKRRPDDASLRKAAASVYLSVGALSRAEAITDDDEGRDRILARRRFYGLPPDAHRFGVPPEREPEYVAAFDEAYQLLSQNEAAPLARTASVGLGRFPGAPGFLALACAADVLGGKPARARKSCQGALAGWEETVLAHFVLGQIETGAPRRRHLERVLELDPAQEPSVKALLERE